MRTPRCRLVAGGEASLDAPLLAVVHHGPRHHDPTPPDATPAGLQIELPVEVLAGGPVRECWTTDELPERRQFGEIEFAHTVEFLFGRLRFDGRDLGPATDRAYGAVLELLARTGHAHALRFWNFVPEVNRVAAEGSSSLERYMVFCRARAEAIERVLGPDFSAHLCASSAVGCRGKEALMYFLAARRPGTRVGNPRQEEPWRYPPRYGPRAPSFARGTSTADGTLFLSGTASIVGHRSLFPGDLDAQLDETLRNMQAVLRESGAGDLGRLSLVKAYVRDPAQARRVRERLEAALAPGTQLVLVQAEICRRELLVEVEGIAQGRG